MHNRRHEIRDIKAGGQKVAASAASVRFEPASFFEQEAHAGSSEPFPPWPSFAEDEIDAVVNVLRSGHANRWTGEQNEQFELEFAAFCECRHAISLANGTVALELALQAFGIGKGDEVIVPSRTFIATASAVVMRGATPVVADIDPVSQNLTAETVAPLLTNRTRAVIAVHLAGWPCDMDPLVELARSAGIKVIEDCAQALGAHYKGRPVGGLGDAAAFSFCQDKIMTTGGEGGMFVTNDTEAWQRAWSYKDHGKNLQAALTRFPQAGFRWLHDTFGTNWRMTEMQAAIGRVALRKVPEWVVTRRRYAAILNDCFQSQPGLRVTRPPDGTYHAYYKYYCFCNSKMLPDNWNRDRILAEINATGVPCYVGSCSAIYLEKAFINAELGPGQCLPVAQELGETSLMFLVHPTLKELDISRTCDVVKKVLGNC